MNSTFSEMEHQNFINLETTRRSGLNVRTPVWFAHANGKIFVRTIANSGKVKRVRLNPVVKIASCTAGGKLLSDWITARARFASPQEEDQANIVLNKKYGLQKRMFDLVNQLRHNQWTVLVIEPGMDN